MYIDKSTITNNNGKQFLSEKACVACLTPEPKLTDYFIQGVRNDSV